ncbi:hypothetical protein Ddc_11263 [Ditylenchus destructor]|nr:hypothetical protein Ddc_11263 [Ditylenchus destructor]
MITNRSYHEIQEDTAGVILPLRVSDELRDIISRVDKLMGKCHPENTISELKNHPFFIVDLEMPEIKTIITSFDENRPNILDEKDSVFYMKSVGSNGSATWISKGFKDEYDWKMLRNKEVPAPVVPHPENPANNPRIRTYMNIDGTELVKGITRVQAMSKL